MLYVAPPINTFSLCSITVNSEWARLWIGHPLGVLFFFFLHRVKEMDKSERLYSILHFDPGKVWACLKKQEETYRQSQ